MIRILKKLIIPSIIVLLFAFVYLVFIPYMRRRNLKESVFKNVENVLTGYNINFSKQAVDAESYGAWKGYVYIDLKTNETITIYVFNKNSSAYDKALTNQYIESSKNSYDMLYAIFYGHCAIIIDDNFSNKDDLLNEFIVIAKNYELNI